MKEMNHKLKDVFRNFIKSKQERLIGTFHRATCKCSNDLNLNFVYFTIYFRHFEVKSVRKVTIMSSAQKCIKPSAAKIKAKAKKRNSSISKSENIDRKSLLKLSKTELIKECKKYKVSTIGSKRDMIDRIITIHPKTKVKHRKTKSKPKDTIKGKRKKSRSGIKDNNQSFIELTVDGYCREIQALLKKIRMTIPKEIIILVLQFHGEKSIKMIRWSKTYKSYSTILSDDSKTARISNRDRFQHVLADDIPIKSSVALWRIKVLL